MVSIWVKKFQSEFMAEIDSESPVIAIGTVLLMKFLARTRSKHIKVMKNDLCL